MSIRFENKKDLERENKAVSFFCKLYGFTFKKLGDNDVDFAIIKNNRIICYLEVKGRNRYLNDCYPLPVAIRKLLKLSDKRLNPVMLWACYDGIIFSRVELLKGEIKTGGRKPRVGSTNDIEIMAYYDKDKNLIEVKYEMQKL
ncbi:MAG: hypothetical protein Unbinned3907contig1000_27 [Prokaryotic dsDNA virus sp.]|nr:MAG: hypothetical protein Unbinned3907contig1000_27 [Prokaryotic dsDNA virus sp.]|tara:strand:- start:2739 stop:3167 length:429 start_codon:yes stop_codon:yes gene_type:complete